jgi:hypothetical protein
MSKRTLEEILASSGKDEKKEEAEDEQEESENDSSDEEDDPELIQHVLAHRLLAESSHKVIDKEDIDNSDDEDVVTMSRRMRHIYVELNNLKAEVKTLRELLTTK